MKYLRKFNEEIRIPIIDEKSKLLFPKTLSLITSNGEYTLKMSDYVVSPPKIYTSYHHSTPEKTGDVLTDGEPDYLGVDFNFMKKDGKYEINMEITYGDAMMFEFKIKKPNIVDIFVYNGYGSKFDPDYLFSFTEESISKLIKLFNRFGFNFSRRDFNFLDSNKNSYRHK